jgi:hypothetical protein
VTVPTTDLEGAALADDDPDGMAVDIPEVALTASSAQARRHRFRTAISDLADRSTSNDLIRWMLVPASTAVVLGFVAMLLGWVGAARTAREIEQVPYLISGGLIGLALVVLGGLLLASTFWVAVLHKLREESDARASAELQEVRARIAELEARAAAPARSGRAPRTTARRSGPGTASSNGSSGAPRKAPTRPG